MTKETALRKIIGKYKCTKIRAETIYEEYRSGRMNRTMPGLLDAMDLHFGLGLPRNFKTPNEEFVERVKKVFGPKGLKTLRRFLGKSYFYSAFIMRMDDKTLKRLIKEARYKRKYSLL